MTDVDITVGGACLDVRFEFHDFPFYEMGVDCWASAADTNSSISAACFHIRFDFHTYGFLS